FVRWRAAYRSQEDAGRGQARGGGATRPMGSFCRRTDDACLPGVVGATGERDAVGTDRGMGTGCSEGGGVEAAGRLLWRLTMGRHCNAILSVTELLKTSQSTTVLAISAR